VAGDYTVVRGDTVAKIAAAHGQAWRDLYQRNVGAIGTGRISRGHDLPGIWQHDIARVMAACDLDRKRVEDAKALINGYYAKKTGKPAILRLATRRWILGDDSDFSDLLAAARQDLVDVAAT